MTDPVKLFIVAGEPSGDRLGADLVRRLRERVPLNVSGVGGHELSEQGLRSIYPMSDLSVMGYADVFKRLPLLLWRLRQTARAIVQQAPDIVVLIDYQEFNQNVAKAVRKAGARLPMLLYVSPTVWAWKPERAPKLRLLFDEVLAILPFEPAAMARLGGPPTHYVGHLALSVAAPVTGHPAEGLVALLPGSREGELRRHLPLFRQVAERLAKSSAVKGFFLPTLPHLVPMLTAELAGWPMPVRLVTDRAERPALYAQSLLAIAGAGTAVLELALAGVPVILTYVMEGRLRRMHEQHPEQRVSLPNIILKEDVVPEILQADADPVRLIGAAEHLIGDTGARRAQTEAFARLRALLEKGEADAPREDPVERVLAHLKSRVPSGR